MSLARDIAQMLLFEADDFDPEEVEQVAKTPWRRCRLVSVDHERGHLGSQWFWRLWLGETMLGWWYQDDRLNPEDPDAEGLFVPSESGEKLDLHEESGTLAQIVRSIQEWLDESGHSALAEAEEFDPTEIEQVAVSPYTAPPLAADFTFEPFDSTYAEVLWREMPIGEWVGVNAPAGKGFFVPNGWAENEWRFRDFTELEGVRNEVLAKVEKWIWSHENLEWEDDAQENQKFDAVELQAILEAEEIAGCAVRLKDGRILTGATHGHIWGEATHQGLLGDPEAEEEEHEDAARKLGWHNGFVTKDGRFVNRREAYKIARQARQVDADASRRLWHHTFHGESEEFDPTEIEDVAGAAITEPYYFATDGKYRIEFDKQWNRLYKDIKTHKWTSIPGNRFVRLKNVKTNEYWYPESMVDDLEAGHTFVGQIWIQFRTADTLEHPGGRLVQTRIFNGRTFYLRKIKKDEPGTPS